MSCRDWARKTVLLLESDLAPEETAEVRRHVASCESCAGLLRELEQARDAVHLLRALEPSTADLDVVRRRVMESLEARKTSFAWLAWKPALAAGAVVAVVLGTWFLVRWNPSQRRDLAGLPAERGAPPVARAPEGGLLPPAPAAPPGIAGRPKAKRPRAVVQPKDEEAPRIAVPRREVAQLASAHPLVEWMREIQAEEPESAGFLMRVRTQDPGVVLYWIVGMEGAKP